MSYADAAAKGPAQSDAEKVPNPIPEVEHSDSNEIHNTDSLGSSGVNILPSYAEQQRAVEEAESQARSAASQAESDAREFAQKTESELQRLEKEAGKKYNEFSAEAKKNYENWKKQAAKDFEKVKAEAKKDGKKVRAEAQKAGEWADENKNNPVVIGNAVVITAVAGLLGVGAYRLHQTNQLTWKVAGAWAGVVGLFAVGDYYVSQYFFKKYPPKQ